MRDDGRDGPERRHTITIPVELSNFNLLSFRHLIGICTEKSINILSFPYCYFILFLWVVTKLRDCLSVNFYGIQMSEFKYDKHVQILFGACWQTFIAQRRLEAERRWKYPLNSQGYENSQTCRLPGFLLHASGLHVAREIISIQMATALLPFTDWKTIEGWWMMKTNGVPSRRTSLSRNGFQGRSSSSQWAFPSLCFCINHVNLLIFKFIHF